MSRCQTCVHSIPTFITSDIYTDGYGQVCCDCKTKVKDGYQPREGINMDKRPIRSCVNCKHENKDICEEPCMDCNITLGNDKWEDKDEQS